MKKTLLALTMAMVSTSSLAGQTMTICGGSQGGFYEAVAKALATAIRTESKITVNAINTGGSIENASKLSDGSCGLAIMQADVIATQPIPLDVKVSDAHTEMVYWLYGAKGVKDFGSMENSENSKKAVAIVSGSGADITMTSFSKTDTDFEKVRRVEFEDWLSAAEATAQGYAIVGGSRVEIAGMMYVGRPGMINKDIISYYGKDLTIGSIEDNSFIDAKDMNGNPLYTHCKVESGMTSGLRTGTMFSPTTYCVRSQVVYLNSFHKDLPDGGKDVRRGIERGIATVLRTIR